MVEMIGRLVRVESPTNDAAAVNRCGALVEHWIRGAGGKTRPVSVRGKHSPAAGDSLVAKFAPVRSGKAKPTGKPAMLLGHLDTVWPVGTLTKMPFRIHGGRAYGPGVLDMKAGIVMAITAVRLLLRTGLLSRPLILLLGSDEETGSETSRRLIESEAARCSEVFVLEPAQGIPGAYKTARKGVGNYRLEVKGVAAHAGVDFERGHSAIRELARQIERISAFTDMSRGITVNAGMIGGGTRTNVVAAEAWVDIDLRISRQVDAARIEKRLRSLRPFDRRCSLILRGGLNRPPMERNQRNAALFRRAATLASEMGITLQEASTGGGSDGNFTSALGIPTLDGMGAVGEGAHADHESILLDSLVPRTALLAAMLAQSSWAV